MNFIIDHAISILHNLLQLTDLADVHQIQIYVVHIESRKYVII